MMLQMFLDGTRGGLDLWQEAGEKKRATTIINNNNESWSVAVVVFFTRAGHSFEALKTSSGCLIYH